METILVENEVQQEVKLLDAINDDHEGVIVELNKPINSDDFASMLRASIAQWRKQVFVVIDLIVVFLLSLDVKTRKQLVIKLQLCVQGKRGVWIKVPIELVNLVEAAVKVILWSLYNATMMISKNNYC